MQRFQLLFKRNKVWRLNRIKVNSSQNKNQQSLQGNNRSRVYMMYHHNELYTAEITRHIKKQGNIITCKEKKQSTETITKKILILELADKYFTAAITKISKDLVIITTNEELKNHNGETEPFKESSGKMHSIG